MDKIYTTLAQIRSHSPCEDGYKKLCKNLGGVRKYGKDTPLTFRQIYESNGYEDTLWCMRAVDTKWYPLWCHFACDCAEDVKHLMKDERSLKAIEVARRHADGLANDEELAAAWDAARAAARDAAWDAWKAAWAMTAGAAAVAAARAAAWAAARAAAWDAAWDAAEADAWDAVGVDVAWDAARAAAVAAQMERLFKYCETGKRS